MLWRGDALLDYTRWRARHSGPLTDLEAAFGHASVEASARGRRVRRGIVAAAFAVLAIGILVLLKVNASKEAARGDLEESDRLLRAQVIALDQEHGRQHLLAGDPIRAAIYLDAGVRAGGKGEALRYMLGRAIAILDKRRLTLVGHAGGVRAGRYSPDGEILVTAGEDKTARVWNAATGRLLTTLSGHEGSRIFSVDIDPTGEHVVTASEDKTARIWDARTGRSLAVLGGHDRWIWVARFSPDGARVVTASIDGTARLWNAATGALVAILRDTGGQLLDVVFAGPDLYLSGEAPAVTRWNATTGEARGRVAAHAGRVTAIAADRSARIATASLDGSVQIHDASGELVTALGTQQPIWHMVFSADGTRLAIAGGPEVQVWDVVRAQRIAAMRGHAGRVTAIAFSPDGLRLASSSDDGTCRLWDAATGQALALIPSLEAIDWLAFSRDGSRIAVGGAGGASVWDSRNDVRRAMLELDQPVSSVALRSDGGEVVACGDKGAVRAWSTRDGSLLSAIAASVKCVAAVTPDGAIVITGDDNGRAQSWDAASGRPLREIAPAAAPKISAIAVSPEGGRVVTGHDDNDARIWEIASGRLLATLTGHTQPIRATAWSPDGARVATCSSDRTAIVWDAASGDRVRTLHLAGNCPAVAFDRAGDQVATANRQVANAWARDGAPAGLYEGHQGAVTSVMFGPPGLLVTTSQDSTIRLWDLATQLPAESLVHPEPVGEADVSLDRSVLASRSGSRVYVWGIDPRASLARVREIVDALPLALRGGVLVRVP
jgi:WD40 repeat protein